MYRLIKSNSFITYRREEVIFIWAWFEVKNSLVSVSINKKLLSLYFSIAKLYGDECSCSQHERGLTREICINCMSAVTTFCERVNNFFTSELKLEIGRFHTVMQEWIDIHVSRSAFTIQQLRGVVKFCLKETDGIAVKARFGLCLCLWAARGITSVDVRFYVIRLIQALSDYFWGWRLLEQLWRFKRWQKASILVNFT